MYYVLFLCCKDTTKSNNRQIFKEKSYYIVYYLTFINRKIKCYYYFMYYLLRCYYNILYISYYITYLIIYRERTKANRKGKSKETDRTGREPGQRLEGLQSCPPRPRSLPSGGEVGQKKRPTRKRENQGEGCRRHLRPFLASLLFRLLPPPSTPSPAFTTSF